MTLSRPALVLALQTADSTLAMRLPYQFCKGFAEDGWQVTVMVVASPQTAGMTTLWNRVPVVRVGSGSNRLSILQMGLRLLPRGKHRIVVSYIWDRHALFLAVSRLLFGTPYALFLDTFEYQAAPAWRGRLKDALRYGLVLRGARVILAETPTAYERARRSFPQAVVLQVPFCLWKSEMEAVEAAWRIQKYAPERRPVILFAGRIIRRKNIHDLLAAFSVLASRFPDWSVEVRGITEDPVYFESLRAQTVALNLEERVRFLPPAYGDDLYKLYRETAVFCLPSEGEGMPSVITEAMFFGGAIVAAVSGCLAYQLDNGECGLLHAPGDVDALTHCLETLMGSPDARADYQANARARVETVFAWETYYPQMKAAFEAALQ